MSTIPATDVQYMPTQIRGPIEPARVVPAVTRPDIDNPDKIRGADLELWRTAIEQQNWGQWP